MKAGAPAVMDLLAQHRKSIIESWIVEAAGTYPSQTSRFLLEEKDQFRNPVGQALRDGLPVLFDEIAGRMNPDQINPVLESLMRMRAVQDFAPGAAVSFIFLLKRIIRDRIQGAGDYAVDERIDQMVMLAFDIFMKCREKMYEIRLNEARRSLFLRFRREPSEGEAS